MNYCMNSLCLLEYCRMKSFEYLYAKHDLKSRLEFPFSYLLLKWKREKLFPILLWSKTTQSRSHVGTDVQQTFLAGLMHIWKSRHGQGRIIKNWSSLQSSFLVVTWNVYTAMYQLLLLRPSESLERAIEHVSWPHVSTWSKFVCTKISLKHPQKTSPKLKS